MEQILVDTPDVTVGVNDEDVAEYKAPKQSVKLPSCFTCCTVEIMFYQCKELPAFREVNFIGPFR